MNYFTKNFVYFYINVIDGKIFSLVILLKGTHTSSANNKSDSVNSNSLLFFLYRLFILSVLVHMYTGPSVWTFFFHLCQRPP